MLLISDHGVPMRLDVAQADNDRVHVRAYCDPTSLMYDITLIQPTPAPGDVSPHHQGIETITCTLATGT